MSDYLPLVSVTIPCYRHGVLVQKAIDSVINQTYQNIEILISEDPSDNESTGFLKKYKNDHRIKYLKNSSRVGMVKNYQILFNRIMGDLALNLDGDDYFINRNFFERCVDEFLKDKNLVLSVSGIKINKDGIEYDIYPNVSEEVVKSSGKKYFLDSILDKIRTNHHFAMMYKVSMAKAIGFYTEDIASTDLESFRRLALYGNVVQINQMSGVWNISDSSYSRGLSSENYFSNIKFIISPLNLALSLKVINKIEYKNLLRTAIVKYNVQFVMYAASQKSYFSLLYSYYKLLKDNDLLILFPSQGMWLKATPHILLRIIFQKNMYDKIVVLYLKYLK